jgi:hypothetical protein
VVSKNIVGKNKVGERKTWNRNLDYWIIEALEKNKNLGRNELYEYVDQRYKESKAKDKKFSKKQKTTQLSRDVFSNHLKFLIENDIVGRNYIRRKDLKVMHFLTSEAQQQLQMRTLDLVALKNKDKKAIKKESSVETEFRALYILILLFNHSTSFESKTKDALEYFLMPFRLSLNRLYTLSKKSVVLEHEEEKYFETILRSPKQEITVSVKEFIRSPIHDTGSLLYTCHIKGML